MSSVQFSHSVMSTPCNPVDYSTPGFLVHQLPEFIQTHVHPTISSFVVPFSSYLQSFPASGSFLMSQLLASDGQNIGASASASVLPMNQFSWVDQSCPTLCDPMNHSTAGSLSITNSRSSLRFTSIESVMPSSHLILCRPLLLLPFIFPNIRVFSNESALHIRWPKYWRYSGLISFRIDWLDLLAVQGTLKSLLQHHSSKALILWCSASFIV